MTGTIKYQQSFDAWGNYRKVSSWTINTNGPLGCTSPSPIPSWLYRGFTGHEHVQQIDPTNPSELINMNGSIYDPVLGRMLSPDRYVSSATSTQAYNRYLYCNNYPLKYTDPSGDFLITAVIDLFTTIFTKGGVDPWNTKANREQAWRNYDPTAPRSKTYKAYEIDLGLFKTDPNRTTGGRVIQLISRFTWEYPQELVGYTYSQVRNLSGNVTDVSYYGGATLVNKKDQSSNVEWGATLGSYINSQNVISNPYNDDIFRHEFGYTLQSRIFGPLYLTNVALPSLISLGLFDQQYGVFHTSHNHDDSWFETEANDLSYLYFNNHQKDIFINNLNTGGHLWDNQGYHRDYRIDWFWLLFML